MPLHGKRQEGAAGGGGKQLHGNTPLAEHYSSDHILKLFKLLSNLPKNFKNSQHKSCSKFKTLQLSQYKLFQIQLGF
jgi:hypothetical protein